MGMLDGIRILDLSRLLPGPASTWYLRGMGAVVDRVEPPGTGDLTRHVPPFVAGAGAFFSSTSRGKRSIALDLRTDAARALLLRMLPRYDVLVEGFRPGLLESMGLGPERLQGANPRLVIARLSGFGQTGPWRERPGHDVNYVGLTGLLAASSPGVHGPVLPPVQIADLSGALVAAMGICAALFERDRRGGGRVLDVSLTEAGLSTMAPLILASTAEGHEPVPGGEMLTGGLPVYGTYACADGRHLTVGALEPKFQAALAATMGSVARDELAAAFAARPRDEWVDCLADACCGPVLALAEIAGHPQHAARGAAIRLAGATWIRPPFGEIDSEEEVPALGAHTDAILTEAGIGTREIEALRSAGVVA